MNTLVFATNNHHKVAEIRLMLGNKFNLITLKEAGLNIDIPEPHNTLKENASEKSKVIYSIIGKNCFSEDTGLEVAALNGEPGVKSARYAGENKLAEDNMDKLLNNLRFQKNRKACFRTIISLILNTKEYFFEGICEGEIATEKKGKNGFGYDAIFVPNGSVKTFAEMELQEKAYFSHRKKAIDKLLKFLNLYKK